MRFGMACLLVSVSLAVSGCGGGGSNSGTTTTTPPTAPTVTAVTPTTGATGVAVNTALTASFSLAMNATSISSSTFTLMGPSGAVAGTVTYAASGIDRDIYAVNESGVWHALHGHHHNRCRGFVRHAVGCKLRVDIYHGRRSSRANGHSQSCLSMPPSASAIDSPLTATFSQAMNAATITSSSFTLTGPGNAAVAGTVTYAASGMIGTFTPSANLAFNTQYTATITTGAADSMGTALAANYAWTFTTAAVPVPPTVASTTPANLATAVPINSVLTATFSQAMTASTITSSTFTLTGPGNAAVSGTSAMPPVVQLPRLRLRPIWPRTLFTPLPSPPG